jgi:NADPH:quinone reductase-like Zn-dependent oxidoreductase
MKAIVFTRYGPPDSLQLKEIDKPVPKDNEILVRIHATTVTAGDCEVRGFNVPSWLWIPLRLYVGVRRPTRITVLGQELAGEVEAAGRDVKRFREGDRVFASSAFGAYAEYICLPENPEDGGIAAMPSEISYDEAAPVPFGGLEALHFLRHGRIEPGKKVLINGAGGSIGTFAVQIAKSFGAEVTGVDSAVKLDMLRSIGADHVIDYTREDFTENGENYDVIFDVIGKSSFSPSLRSLRQEGVYLLANPSPSQMVRGPWVSMRSSKKVVIGAARRTSEDLIYLRGLIEAGKIRSVVDKCFSLEQMAEAHRYAESGLKKGNIVIQVVPNGAA